MVKPFILICKNLTLLCVHKLMSGSVDGFFQSHAWDVLSLQTSSELDTTCSFMQEQLGVATKQPTRQINEQKLCAVFLCDMFINATKVSRTLFLIGQHVAILGFCVCRLLYLIM